MPRSWDSRSKVINVSGRGLQDTVGPIPALTSDDAGSTIIEAVEVRILFDEAVSGFTVDDLTIVNGTPSNFTAISTSEYTVDVAPISDGIMSVRVLADVCIDDYSNSNQASNTVNFTADVTLPTCVVSSAAPAYVIAAFDVALDFSEAVTGFALEDITVTNGTPSNFAGSGSAYTATITPSGQGATTVKVNASACTDIPGNPNTESNTLSRIYDTVAPTCVLTTTADAVTIDPIPVTATFSEDVTGFVVGDITVTNGAAGSFVAVSGSVYTFTVTPTLAGPVTVQVAAATCIDAATNSNTASNLLERIYFQMLLRDDFLTTAGAPLSSPRTCEPGPGTLTLVQTDGEFSISSEKLVFPAQTTPAWADQMFYDPVARTREPGLTVLANMKYTSGSSAEMGWSHAVASLPSRIGHYNSTDSASFVENSVVSSSVSAPVYGLDLVHSITARKVGGYYFVKRGGVWRLVWVSNINNTTTLYSAFANLSSVGTIDTFRVAKLPGLSTDTQPGNGYKELGHLDLDTTYSYAGNIPADTTFAHTPDFYAEFDSDIAGVDATDVVNMWFRYTVQTTDSLRVKTTGNGVVSFYQSGNLLASGSGVVNGSRIRCLAINGTIKVWVDGSLQINTALVVGSGGFTGTPGKLALGGTSAASDLVIKTLDGAATYPWTIPVTLADSDMEAEDFAAWSTSNNPTLSKETVGAYEGTRWAKIMYTDQNAPQIFQTCMTIGKSYRIRGWARGDGTVAPRIATNLSVIWTGASATYWQPFDFTFVADQTNIYLRANANGAGQYAGFDSVTIAEVNPNATQADYAGSTVASFQDGDMELANTDCWVPYNNALITKETDNPHGGSRVLRVAYNGTGSPWACPIAGTTEVGQVYRLTGWARGDGTRAPTITSLVGTIFTGTSSTAWQKIDVTYTAAVTRAFALQNAASAGYVEFDDLVLTRINLSNNPPAGPSPLFRDGDMELAGVEEWNAVNNATMTKETTSPQAGTQWLKVMHNDAINPRASQNCLVVGRVYRVRGYARGDGVVAPRVQTATSTLWTGTTSTAWQPFDATFTADSIAFHLRAMTANPGEYAGFDSVTIDVVSPGAGIATRVRPGPRAAGDLFTHEADCIFQRTVSVVPTTSTIHLIRMQNATNYWYLKDFQGTHTELWEYVAGAPTYRAGSATATPAGSIITVVAENETISCYVGTTLAYTYAAAVNFKTATQGKVDSLGGGIPSNLIAWPRTPAAAPYTSGAANALAALEALEQ